MCKGDKTDDSYGTMYRRCRSRWRHTEGRKRCESLPGHTGCLMGLLFYDYVYGINFIQVAYTLESDITITFNKMYNRMPLNRRQLDELSCLVFSRMMRSQH